MLNLKMALLRSEGKLKAAVSRLLHVLKLPPCHVFSMLSIEQEYQLVDKKVVASHPEIGRIGRAFSPLMVPNVPKELLRNYLRDVEVGALKLGIPLKIQQKVRTLFEKTPQAIEHNHLLMQLMQEMAKKYELTCLLHEKPFVNHHGSGKPCSWAIYTDTGQNLFDSKSPMFSWLMAALARAVAGHGALFWAAVASAGNDDRLVLPQAISFDWVDNAVQCKALGASMDATLLFIVMHASFADSLELILDEMGKEIPTPHPSVQGKKSYYAFQELLEKRTIRVLDGVLSGEDLRALYEAKVKEYVEIKERETEFFDTEEIQKVQARLSDLGWEAKGKVYCELINPKMDKLK